MKKHTPKYPNHLARLRRLKGLRYKQVARLIGVSPKTIMRWERGEVIPNGKYLFRFSLLYEQPVEQLYMCENTECAEKLKEKYRSLRND
jgi:transcriptional regulator with XRE-family HTH domain